MEKFLNTEKIKKKFTNHPSNSYKDNIFITNSFQKKFQKKSTILSNITSPKKNIYSFLENSNTTEEHIIDKNCFLITNNEEDRTFDLNLLFKKVCKGEKIIENSNKINCIILKYGNKPSLEPIEYTFCKTCDSNLINPICIECINNCHKGHNIKKNFLKGNIQCICGQKLHKIEVQQNFFDITACTFSEWSLTSKLNYYYVKSNKNPICIFCHNFCSENKNTDVLVKAEKNNEIPDCSCTNYLVHSEHKRLLEKINLISFNDYEILELLHPIQILNLIFQSKNSFNKTYVDFIETYKHFMKKNIINLILPYSYENFIDTNSYLSLLIFENLLNKNQHTGLRYYCKEIETIINFEMVKNYLKTDLNHHSISFFCFAQKIIHIFNKVFIGNKTQSMDKYKLYDLENFTCFIRIVSEQTNLEDFSLAKDISVYFLFKLDELISNGFNSIESYDFISEIFSVFKKLSIFNLISNGNMMRICLSIDKLFTIFSIIRNNHIKKVNELKKSANFLANKANINFVNLLWQKESKYFYIISKMLNYFIYTYNDRMVYKILFDVEKYPFLINIHQDSALFIFNKTEIGRLISKIAIRIMNILITFYSDKTTNDIYIKIMKNCMKILDFMLSNKDSYLLQLEKLLTQNEYYFKVFNTTRENSPSYDLLCKERDNIELSYCKYFCFEINFEQVIKSVNESLEKIMGNETNKFSENKIIAIYRSNYFYSLRKIFDVINYKNNELNDENGIKKNFNEVFNKVFLFYNNYAQFSADNALLILSQYIFRSLTNAPIFYGEENFKLFLKCCKLIEKNDKIISYNKHIIKNLFNYLNKLFENKLNNFDDCLLLFFQCIESIVLKTKSLLIEISIFKIHNILKECNDKFHISEKFFNNLTNSNEIFLIFIKLVNSVFDYITENEKNFAISLIDPNQAIKALKETIEINIRTELLRFIRKVFIDLKYVEAHKELYISSIVSNENKLSFIKANEFLTNFDYPTKYLSFLLDLYNCEMKDNSDPVFENSSFDSRCYEIFENEIKNIPNIIKTILTHEELTNYLENGVLIPTIYFIKKCFYIAHYFSGQEVLNLYNLIFLTINLKNFIAEYNTDFWKEKEEKYNLYENEKNEKKLEYVKEYLKNFITIDGSFCVMKNIVEDGIKDCKNMESFKFNSFDYTSLYFLAEKHLFCLLKDFPVMKISESFSDGSEKLNLKIINNIENENFDNLDEKKDLERRMIRAYILYKYGKESIIDENNSSLFSCLDEICLEFESNFHKLLVAILIHNGKQTDIFVQFSKMSNFLLFKLLSLQTTETQMDIIDLLGGTDSEDLGFLIPFKDKLIKSIILLFLEYLNPQDKLISFYYINSYNLIKIFKFLCEEHNNFFQGHLIKSVSFEYFNYVPYYFKTSIFDNNTKQENLEEFDKENIKLFDFLLYVLSKIILISKWGNLRNEDLQHQQEFLYDLFAAILELEIEIIQGNKPEYLSRIGNPQIGLEKFTLDDLSKNSSESKETERFNFDEEEINDPFQIFVNNILDLIFDNQTQLELIFEIRNQLMQFFTAILEEKNCNEEVQKFIIKNFNLHKILNSISTILKTYYIENKYLGSISKCLKEENFSYKDEDTTINFNSRIEATVADTKILNVNKLNLNNLEQIKKVRFNHNIFIFLKKEYYNSEEFSKSNEFELANIFYKYIKLISVQGKNEEALELIKKVNKMKESSAHRKFSKLLKISEKKNRSPVEIGNLINENIQKYDENFVEKFYIVKFFENITKTVEVRTEDVNNRNQIVIFTKLPDIQFLSKETKIEFERTVIRTSETSKKNDLVEHVQLFMKEIRYNKKNRKTDKNFFDSLDYTFIQWFSYCYALWINLFMIFTLKGDTRTTHVDTLETRRKDTVGIKNLINKSIDDWGNYYNIFVYIFVILNLCFIISWIYFRMPLYYRLDKIIYMEENNITDKNKLKFFDKFKIAVINTIWHRDYISTLIFEFIISLIGAIMKRGEIIYPFLLLAILDLNLGLKNIIISVQEKYKELALTFVLMVLIMYVFSNIAFFFFDEDYAAELDYYDDNVCSSLLFCFLTALDSGLRARGGLGDSGERISFARFPGHYAGRIITDDLFFFIIIIIMIDLVFGIVIEAFNVLGAKEQKQKNDVTNHCFICHINKATVEKNRQNFNEHREKRHNLWNYVDYMIFLKFGDIHDLNAINSYARNKLDNKDISWLPTYKDSSSNNENKREDNEDSFSVADENINKYIVKEA